MKRHALGSKSLIEIGARKWFDRINGNTYHAVIVCVVNGEERETLRSNALVYGYGDGYQQTACELLQKAGYRMSAATVKRINKLAGYEILRGTDITPHALHGLRQYGHMAFWSVSENCLKRELKELVS
jgi:hypothetical protein